ncbi:MAG: AAA family ATPase [Rikenellaceae bacterium]
MDSISIKNYKNLRDLKIASLSKVNLIVGMNNSGKSTLLEAISIVVSGGDIAQFKKIFEMRGLEDRIRYTNYYDGVAGERERDNFLTLYNNLDYEDSKKIEIETLYQGNKNTLLVEMVNVVEEWFTENNGDSVRRRRVLEAGDEYLGLNAQQGLMITKNAKQEYLSSFANMRSRFFDNKKVNYQYVHTSSTSSIDNPNYFDAIALTDLEQELIHALNIIEPQIEAINFLKFYSSPNSKEDNRVPIVVYKGSAKRYRLSTMGDGINRILTIMLAMLNCKGGVLLVDEFDNGLHYSVQTKLWEVIYHLANVLNIQVFATTHSDDCIKSFIKADASGDGKLIRLENRDGDIVSVEYDEPDELDYISTSNIEVR